jgi:hypothetical protein
MEEVLLALAQFLIETLFPILLELIIQLIVNWWPTDTEADAHVLLIFAGCLLGAISGLFLPSPFANHIGVQALAMVFGPILAALSAARLTEARERQGKSRLSVITGWRVYSFSFAFLLARSAVLHKHKLLLW